MRIASSFWSDVGTNVFASCVYTLLVAAVVLGASGLLLSRQRKQLFAMLGLDGKDPVLRLYLSRLDVLPGGSRGTDGRLASGFVGPALMQLEYRGARAICRLLEEPFLDILPDAVRRLLEGRGRYLADVDVNIDVSPASEQRRLLQDRGSDAVVLLGSDVYSTVVRDIYEGAVSFVRFVAEDSGSPFDASDSNHGDPTFAISLDNGWHTIPARSGSRELGTVQRVTLPSGRRVLMCAGVSASATQGSAEYFARRWSSLREEFGDDDFLVVLSFASQEADSPVVTHPERLRDFDRRRSPSRAAP